MQAGYPDIELLEEVKEEKGALFLYRVRPGVFLSEATGHLSANAAKRYGVHGTHVLSGQEGARVFNDWGQMRGYESAARAELTRWASATLTRGAQVDFFTTSAIVSMGISTASIALVVVGITIVNHPTRAEFQAALSSVST